MEALVPLFVCGSPRSGTTLMGHYLGTSSVVLHLGEYGGLFLSFRLAPQMWMANKLSQTPLSPYMQRYYEELRQHAINFPQTLAPPGLFRFWCDSAPQNLTIVKDLVEQFPQALYILMIRHHKGVMQSLARAFAGGEIWAGRTWSERARIWTRAYENVPLLPTERTIAVSYDKLCASPADTISHIQDRLRHFGVPPESLDTAVFAKSWATDPTEQRPTIGSIDESGALRLSPRTASGAFTLAPDVEDSILPIVNNTRLLLKERFPGFAEYV
ncbi:MAG: sulfotransferase family protein [Egibacteraceae bacterium]